MLSFNFEEFERAAVQWGYAADQVAFAGAQALNDASTVARQELINNTWPQHVKVRNAGFIKASLSREFATKRNLRVTIFDKLDRGNLLLHSEGGSRVAQSGSLAIPSAKVEAARRSSGVPKGLRPRGLPNSFRRGDEIYQRTGKGKSKSLKLMYTLKPSARIKATVPFEDDFNRVMSREMWPAFRTRMAAAMATRIAR